MSEPDKCIFLAIMIGGLFAIFIINEYYLRRRPKKEESNEVTHYELTQYDELPSGVAVTMAWADATAETRIEVREKMPILARNLDRLVKD